MTFAPHQPSTHDPRGQHSGAVARLAEIAREELDRGIVPGVSVALVADRQTVFAGGFGLADKQAGTPATADTVYRAGSISKVLTAVAAMQLVERGVLDLDAPVTSHVPDFRVRVPFENAGPITLRQLMCHGAGLPRESPVGSYFDDTGPDAKQTAAAVAGCDLIYSPGSRTHYSNVGPTVVGLAVEQASGLPFERYQRDRVLEPAGMSDSSWRWRDVSPGRAATGYMRRADGAGGFDDIVAPRFDLGTIPSGNLYSSAADLARFASALLADHAGGAAPALLRPGSLDAMFTPQLTSAPTGFGLGFTVGEFRGHRTVQHTGAVYGFNSSLTLLPDAGLAVVVLANADFATGPVARIADAAAALMLEAKRVQAASAPPAVTPVALSPTNLAAFAGAYESAGYWADVTVGADGRLVADVSGQMMELTPQIAARFAARGRYANESPFEFERDAAGGVVGFTALGQRFARVDPAAATATSPDEWRPLLGVYGKPFIPLVVSARHGHLYAMTENLFDYRLRPAGANTFRMPPGLYEDELVVFDVRGDDGACAGVTFANVYMPRIRNVARHVASHAQGPS